MATINSAFVGSTVCVFFGFAIPAIAHPHVFVDAGLEVIFDPEGRATALRISWSYDEYYSLVIVEERGLDSDYDGNATPQEATALAGFDMAWDASFDGDTYALMDGVDLALSRPTEWTAVYEGGKITSSHLRTFAEPVVIGTTELIVQAYDPSYYSAYAIVGSPVLTGGPATCSVGVFAPDPDAADAILQAAIDEQAGSTDVESTFPAIGAAYSDEARVTCIAEQ
jgi:ABC-type uncharacterized transport system substrate-binding protein